MTVQDSVKAFKKQQIKGEVFDQDNFLRFMKNEKDFIKQAMEEEKNKEIDSKELFGADGFRAEFIYGIVNSSVHKNMPKIARNYLRYRTGPLSGLETGKESISGSMHVVTTDIIGFIYDDMKNGDEYAKKFLLQIYTQFFNKEYQQLKRFKEITLTDVYEITKEEDAGRWIMAFSRVIGIADLLGIKRGRGIADVVTVIVRSNEEDNANKELKEIEEPDEDKISKIQREEAGKKSTKEFKHTLDAAKVFMEYYGSHKNSWILIEESENWGAERAYARELLKKEYPKRTFTDSEIQVFAVLFGIIGKYEVSEIKMRDYINAIAGFEDSIESEIDGIIWKEIPAPEEEEENKWKGKCEELKARIRRQVRTIENLQQQIEEKETQIYELWKENRELEQVEPKPAESKEDKVELTALRNYVYQMTEKETYEKRNIKDLEEELRGKRITIIGGHQNWTKIFADKFKDWTFYAADVGKSLNESVLKNSDMIFFFTDYLSHASYEKAMNIIKKNNIKVGYINTTNYENGLKQIVNVL